MASIGSNFSVNEPDASASRAEVVVAFACYNHSRTIGPLARAVREVLTARFGTSGTRILLADGGSTDQTREAARAAVGSDLLELEFEATVLSAEMPYHGFPGRVNALRAILEMSQRLHARAGAVVDGGTEMVEPQRIEHLLAPILTNECDYVASYSTRTAFDGAITKAIVYPVFRALYGPRLRQPAAGEFACSGGMADELLKNEFWDREGAEAGVDLWLVSAAVCGGFRVCEAALGARRAVHHETALDLSTTLTQVVGSLFADLERRGDVWQRVRKTVPVPIVGAPSGPATDTSPPNADRLIESFRLGYRELRDIWTCVLPPRTIIELGKLAAAPPDRFRLDDHLWASIIYDFAFGYSLRVMPRDHLLRSLTPLYTAWMASFVMQMQNATPAEVEERIEQVCIAFESQKRYLVSRWRWPERLRR